MSARAPHVCPVCASVVARLATSFPFCSAACKVVDLGRWFDGTYRIPTPEQDGDAAHITTPSAREEEQ